MVTPKKKKLAVLISGRGSNMVSILQATRDADYPAEIALVISDNCDAGGVELARSEGIKALCLERAEYSSKQDHEHAVAQAIDSHDIDLVCLAGYMRLLSGEFTNRYSNRLINIHPSLLPKFKGLDTHARAIAAGETEHGCTIHYVNAVMDGGEIIAQSRVDILPHDTPETLASRVLVEEHKLYPETIRRLCSGLMTED